MERIVTQIGEFPYRTFNMEDFKVSLESLYNNKIKDISFDEEETYQE